MYLKSLFLQQFRNYHEALFEFDSSLNLIYGPNTLGKTTLLEAIHYLMFGRSFRPGQNQDLILKGANSLYLEALFSKHGVDQRLRLYVEGSERRFMHNQTTIPTISKLLGIVQGVVMTPDDVQLIKGSPALRRHFLDSQLAQVDPLYVFYLSRYVRAMRQRNQLLKQKISTSIESWENEMAQAASYITTKRRQCVKSLQPHCKTFYSYMTGEKETLSMRYISGISSSTNEEDIKSSLLNQYNKNRPREMLLGHTLSGPHKDDLWIGIGEQEARFFASEGQQRSCIASLKIGEWRCLRELADDSPLFMIDDVTMSLDSERLKKLIDQLASLGQVFLTSTDGGIGSSFPGKKKDFPLAELLPA